MMCAWEHANGRSIVGARLPRGSCMTLVVSFGRRVSIGT
jgi:hypothetical protein